MKTINFNYFLVEYKINLFFFTTLITHLFTPTGSHSTPIFSVWIVAKSHLYLSNFN